MKKVIPILLLLGACSTPGKLPNPPKNSEVITEKVPVPVLCKVEIDRAKLAIDDAKKGLELEVQNAILRQTIAEQQAYIKALEAGVIGCGGKIK